jgi:hypothetical protein
MLSFCLFFLRLRFKIQVVISKRSRYYLVDAWLDSLSFKDSVGLNGLDSFQTLLLDDACHFSFDIEVHQIVLVFVEFIKMIIVRANSQIKLVALFDQSSRRP